MFIRLSLVLVGCLAFAVCVSGQCEPWQINAHLVKGDQASALKSSERCVDTYKADAPKKGKYDLTSEEWLAVISLAHHFCGTAQVQAMMGKQADAAKSIEEAEKVHDDWSGWFDNPLIDWKPVIEVTKGFALEEAGDIKAAKRWYIDHPSDYTRGRLAVLAVSSNIDEARQYARDLLTHNPKNPTAHAVLAAIMEKSGNQDGALAEYRSALKQMSKEELQNEFLPVVVAESAAVNLAIARLMAAKPK